MWTDDVRRVQASLEAAKPKKKPPPVKQHDGTICRICLGLMVRTGTCETCTVCGETTGCG